MKINIKVFSFIDYKHKVYAAFQFITLALWILFTMTFLSFSGTLSNSEFDSVPIYNEIGNLVDIGQTFDLGKALAFGYKSTGALGFSALMYVDFFLLIINWLTGALIFRFKNRNLFDIMFLLFFIIPILSNVIAFFAQVTKIAAVKEIEFDKDNVYSETWEKLASEGKISQNPIASEDKVPTTKTTTRKKQAKYKSN